MRRESNPGNRVNLTTKPAAPLPTPYLALRQDDN